MKTVASALVSRNADWPYHWTWTLLRAALPIGETPAARELRPSMDRDA
jgi:hypothetical protein